MRMTSLTIAQRGRGNSLGGASVCFIRTAADLNLLQQPRAARRRLYVVLEIAGIPPEQSLRWESRLNTLLRECGCTLGARFSAAALFASIIWQFLQHAWNLPSWPAFLLRTGLAVFIAGGLGKLAGLGLAEFRIRCISSRLTRLVENRSGERG
jgi:hypothetical protein